MRKTKEGISKLQPRVVEYVEIRLAIISTQSELLLQMFLKSAKPKRKLAVSGRQDNAASPSTQL